VSASAHGIEQRDEVVVAGERVDDGRAQEDTRG
jgi:hypothetical protein